MTTVYAFGHLISINLGEESGDETVAEAEFPLSPVRDVLEVSEVGSGATHFRRRFCDVRRETMGAVEAAANTFAP